MALVLGMALGHLGPPSALLRAITLAGATATLVLMILEPRLALAPALLCIIGLGGVIFQRSPALGPLDLSRPASRTRCTPHEPALLRAAAASGACAAELGGAGGVAAR